MAKTKEPRAVDTPCVRQGHDFIQVAQMFTANTSQYGLQGPLQAAVIFCRRCGEKRTI